MSGIRCPISAKSPRHWAFCIHGALMVAMLLGGQLISPLAQAATEFDLTLDFGTLAVRDKSTQGSVSVDLRNQMSVSDHFVVIKSGHAATILLSGYSSYTRLTVKVSVLQAAMQAGAEEEKPFTLTSVFAEPTVKTDGNGMAEVTVGGTITSSTSPSAQYIDASYQGQILVSVSY